MSPSPESGPVALTGASGFVGSAIRAALEAEGFGVRVLSSGGRQGSVPLPAPDAPLAEFWRVLEGARHLVHAGARNNADRRLGDEAYFGPNVALSAKLADAAAEVVPGRAVFLSSIRAVAGPLHDGPIRENTPPAPACAYGRSKREAERAFLAAFSGAPERLAILRLAPVYGTGMGGGLRTLLRLAGTGLPLPLENLPGRRSLLGLEAAASAVLVSLRTDKIRHPAMLASDRSPVTLAEIVAAFRTGRGRPRRLVAMPLRIAEKAARLAGKESAWRALTASQVCFPEHLAEIGWTPPATSLPGLEAAAWGERRRNAKRPGF